MGAFRDPAIAESALSLVLSKEFDPRESWRIMQQASREPQTRDLAYQFVKGNFDRLVEQLPRDFGAFLPSVGQGYCDPEHRVDVETFFKDRSTRFAGGPRILANVLEGIDLCVALKRVQERSVEAFFRQSEAPVSTRVRSN
jgi:alanyl aminopeptidase